MSNVTLGKTTIPAVLAAAFGASVLTGSEWPQWLGPSRNGAADVRGVVPRGEVRLRVAWRRPLGVGAAGLSVAGPTLVTLDSDGANVAAVALAPRDGSVLWRSPLAGGLPDEDAGPASTPAVDGERAYVLSPACVLSALELATGKPVWQVDLKARFATAPRRGCTSAPLLDGGHVVVQTGAAEDHRIVALAARTGEVAWSAKGSVRATYSSPGLRVLGGERQVLVHDTDIANPAEPKGGITALRAEDGRLLWRAALEKYWSWATPVPFGEDRVLLVTWNDATAFRAAASATAPEKAWTSAGLTAYVGTPVYHDGHLYGYGGDFLRCLEARGGATVWEEKTYPGSVALVDGHLVVLSVTAGLVRVVEATPAAYRERARLLALTRGARAETPPSLAGRRIFVRNDEEAVAIDIEG